MNCPVCKTPVLVPHAIGNGLAAHTCKTCEGYWLSSEHYFSWLSLQDRIPLEQPLPVVSHEVMDVKKAKLCPVCATILIKYHVGRGIDFMLDHCGSCNGVWFDKNEWQVLKGQDLHREIHSIFTTPWQSMVREEKKRKYCDEYYTKIWGDAVFAEVKKTKQLLDNHPQRSTILAFLSDQD